MGLAEVCSCLIVVDRVVQYKNMIVSEYLVFPLPLINLPMLHTRLLSSSSPGTRQTGPQYRITLKMLQIFVALRWLCLGVQAFPLGVANSFIPIRFNFQYTIN
jgi:hypothetical protein